MQCRLSGERRFGSIQTTSGVIRTISSWRQFSSPSLNAISRSSAGWITGCGGIKTLDWKNLAQIESMPFSRPAALPYPQVWHRFTVTRRSGDTLRLRVQDLTEELFDESVRLLLTHFTADEPPCKHIEIHKHPGALKELEKLWRSTLQDRLSLVCVQEREGECGDSVKEQDGKCTIVGLNVLTVVCRDDKDEPFHTEDPVWAQLFGAVELVSHAVDVHQYFGVTRYLTAYGLVVVPEYRGMNIGTEILRARAPLCRALDIKITATVFTAAASQAVAVKAGFLTLFEVSYEELARKGFVFPGVETSTKYSKLMALVVE